MEKAREFQKNIYFCFMDYAKAFDPTMQETRETWIWSLRQEDPLEKEMATHPSIVAWEIPWAEEPGGVQSLG